MVIDSLNLKLRQIARFSSNVVLDEMSSAKCRLLQHKERPLYHIHIVTSRLPCDFERAVGTNSVPENPINPMLSIHCCFQCGNGHGSVNGQRARGPSQESEYGDHSMVTAIIAIHNHWQI